MARARHKPQSPGLAAPSRGKATWALAIAAGLAVRIFAVQYSTEYGYFGDHDDFVRWGIQAIDEGVLTLYDHAPPRWDARSTDGRAIRQRPVDRVCNYPPLSVYVLWLNGGLLKLADPDRIINTPTSRNLFAIWGIVADFVLAFGCVALVRARTASYSCSRSWRRRSFMTRPSGSRPSRGFLRRRCGCCGPWSAGVGGWLGRCGA
jgi:hypothetical protein